MKKKWFLVIALASLIIMAGCGMNEKKILSELEEYGISDKLLEGEIVDGYAIEETGKRGDTQYVNGTLESHTDDINYKKRADIYYSKDDKGAWKIADVAIVDSSKWETEPRQGVSEKTVEETLSRENIQIDGEPWSFNNGAIKELKIEDQKTDLENQTDSVTVSLVLEDEVENAEGTLNIEYSFNHGWKIDSINGTENIQTVEKPGMELNVEESDLIKAINEAGVYLGDESTGLYSSHQDIEVDENRIADFEITDTVKGNKGKAVIYLCSFKIIDPCVEIRVESEVPYEHRGAEGWISLPAKNNASVESVNMTGTWVGTYTTIGSGGSATLELKQNADGTWEGLYTWVPQDDYDGMFPGGSYTVTGQNGAMDMNSLVLTLDAGDWVEKPEGNKSVSASRGMKTGLTLIYYVDKGTLYGSGHDRNNVTFKKQ